MHGQRRHEPRRPVVNPEHRIGEHHQPIEQRRLVEIWLALYFLGQPRSILDALVIEALVQAISSAAFVVPGALGVQEGGFLLIGAALGIDGTTALALAAARRLRDVIVFFPGLIAWQWAETRAQPKPENASEPR